MRTPNSIESSQRKLFALLAQEIEFLGLKKDKKITQYEKKFFTDLPKLTKAVPRSTLFKEIKTASVVLVGDYHSLRQSQKGFTRLLNQCFDPKVPTVIALECVRASKQKQLDYFFSRVLSLEELREQIDFDDSWPFPWDHYREIFEFGRNHDCQFLALDSELPTASLHERDKLAAELIAPATSNSRVFVLYGELHLARSHLPQALQKKIGEKKILVIHQNETSLYWKAPKVKNGDRPEVLRLRKNEFCIFNTVPWIKLRSYLDWLEGNFDDEWIDQFDLSGSIQELTSLLAQSLKLPNPNLEAFQILGSDQVGDLGKLDSQEKILLQYGLQAQRPVLFFKKKVVICPSTNVNSLCESASLLLWAGNNRKSGNILLQFCLGYLGSKILNPKRKCTEISEIRAFLKNTQTKKTLKISKRRKIFQKALSLLRHNSPADKKNMEAFKIAGYILANRIFHAKNPGFVQQLFLDPNPPQKMLAKIRALTKGMETEGKFSGF